MNSASTTTTASAAHTPGPWYFKNKILMAGKNGMHLLKVEECPGLGRALEANYRLIEAGPGMLKALRRALPVLRDATAMGLYPEDDPSDRLALDAVIDAIQAATGETV